MQPHELGIGAGPQSAFMHADCSQQQLEKNFSQ